MFKLNKIQYLTEQSIMIITCFILLLLLVFMYPHEIIIISILLSGLLIGMLTLAILKYKRKWFKPQKYIPNWINVILGLSVFFVFRLSVIEAISPIYGILYPTVLITLLAFIDYRLNFCKKSR